MARHLSDKVRLAGAGVWASGPGAWGLLHGGVEGGDAGGGKDVAGHMRVGGGVPVPLHLGDVLDVGREVNGALDDVGAGGFAEPMKGDGVPCCRVRGRQREPRRATAVVRRRR